MNKIIVEITEEILFVIVRRVIVQLTISVATTVADIGFRSGDEVVEPRRIGSGQMYAIVDGAINAPSPARVLYPGARLDR